MLAAFIRLSCAVAAAVAAIGVLPAQTITNLSPSSRVAGDPQFTLFVSGTGFNSCTRVRWNGQDLSTAVSSATLMNAQVPAALIANAGTASVTAFRYNSVIGTSTISCTSTGTGSNSITFNIHPTLAIASASPLPPGRVNQTYTQYEFQVSGGQPQANYTWGLVQGSTLPPGLNLSSSGLLTGVATQAGTFQFTVRVADCVIDCGLIHSATKAFTVTIQGGITIAPTSIPSGSVCANYTQQFTATGGVQPYTFSAAGLPPGLTFSGNSITGTPSQTGTFTVTIRATDSSNQQASQTYTLTVGPSAFAITTSTLPSGRVGTAYDQTISATGGTFPYSWSAASGLPPGLAVSTVTNNGRLAGTPTQAGTFQAVIRVADTGTCVATRTFPISIAPGDLQIVTTALNPGFVGTAYSQTLQGTGGTTPYNWAIVSAQVPGLVLSPGGVLSGIPTAAGSFPITVALSDNAQARVTRNFTVVVTAPLTITTPTLNSGSVGASYAQTLQASGGAGGYSWSIVSGQVPGLTLSSGGALTGIPVTAGTFPLTIQVMDSSERTVTRNYTLQVASTVTIVTTSLNNGAVGVPYSQALQAAGGSAPYTWAVSGGQLPQGLSLNTAGVISGTPQVGGTFGFSVQVTDNAQAQATRTFSLQVSSGLTITTSSLPPARIGAPYEQALQASGGFGALQWSSLTGLPPGFTISTTGVLAGTPSSTGDFPVVFQVMDASGATATRSLLLNILSTFSILTESLPSAQAGVAYTTNLSASGGVVPYRWQALNELPAGLTLDPFGVLSGTVQQTGSFPVNVQVADSAGGTATRQFTLTVTSQFRISTEGLPNGSVGVFYNSLLQSQGGRAPVRWGLDSGQLPLGLILNSNTGAIAGTPQQSGEFRFTIFANDADQLRATRAYTVTIRGQFTITTTSLPAGTVGTAYSQTLATTGGGSPFRWLISDGALPAGLQIGIETGVIAGTPTAAGTFDFTAQATDNNGLQARQQYSLVINSRGQFTITTQSLPNGTVGTAYSQTLATTGGASPLRWSISAGALPTGLQLGAANGVISGTPTAAGVFDFTVQAIDNGNLQAQQRYSVTIIGPPSITNTSLPGARLTEEYTAVVEATGGEAPYTWSQTGLPAGLTLDAASGLINGIPTNAGSFNVTITVRDNAGLSASRQFTIVVASGLSITLTSLPAGTVGTSYSQTLQAAGGSGGFVWSVTSGALPAGLTLAAGGALQGAPTRPGDFAFTAQVRDSQGNTATQAFTIRIADLVLSRVTIRTATLQAGAGDQPGIVLELTDPAPAALTGTLSLSFVSDAGGATDRALQFSQGATPSFTIAQASRTAVFSGGPLSLQLGTIAGTATVTARMTAGGVDVTPSPAPALAIRIERAVPVIRTMTLTRTATAITVEVTGFATSREMTSAEIQFAVRQGANVQTNTFTVPVTPQFTTWYTNTDSLTYGSAFTLSMPFNVTGSTADLTGVTVTLVNSVGRSQPRTGTF